MFTQTTGIAPNLDEQAMHREPANIDARWKTGGEAMLEALTDVLTCGVSAQELDDATEDTLPALLGKSNALAAIHRAAGMKGVKAVATRILPDLAQFPSYLVATLSDIFRGAKMQFLVGWLPWSSQNRPGCLYGAMDVH
eukprot:4934660-Heterocapsa_arctica.AAC.1